MSQQPLSSHKENTWNNFLSQIRFGTISIEHMFKEINNSSPKQRILSNNSMLTGKPQMFALRSLVKLK